VKPRSAGEVEEAVRAAEEAGACLHPWGRGSGVLGAALPPPDCAVLDLSGLNEVNVDSDAQAAHAGAGATLEEVDAAAGRHGLTLPLRPQSMGLASVGGATQTLASGWLQPCYGNVEDVLLYVDIVVGGGRRLRLGSPRSPRGVEAPLHPAAVLGAEGALGAVVGVGLRLRRKPGGEARGAQAFPTVEAALEAARALIQWSPPALLRVFDEREASTLLGVDSPVLAYQYYALDGAAAEALAASAERLSRSLGGRPLDGGVVERFLRERGRYAEHLEALAAAGLTVDTIDLAAGWGVLPRLWRAALQALDGVEGVAAAMGHAGHFYPGGGALYLIVVAEGLGPLAAAWRRVMGEAERLRAAVTHHHGIGRMKLPWAARSSPGSLEALCRLAEALDPRGVFRGSPLRLHCKGAG